MTPCTGVSVSRRVTIRELVDAHCHLHEFTDVRIREFVSNFTIVAVSDDEPSSRKTLELAKTYDSVVPCVGVHPWMVDKVPSDEADKVCKLAGEAMCIGEVGLDTKFVPDTIERQREFFLKFLNVAKEYSLPMNIHSAGAWREVFDLVIKYDIERANFHWYTGPLDLLEEIVNKGYFVSINPAIKIQKKHQEVAKLVPLDRLLLESDGPYSYRGLELEPPLIRDTVNFLSNLKNVPPQEIIEKVRNNLRTFLKI